MGKLTILKPMLACLPSRIAYTQDPAAKQQSTIAPPDWRSWYKLAKWRKLRWSILVRDLFTCQMCGKVQPDHSQLHADHIKRHRGNPKLFWDPKNLQTLCADPCHNKHKQQQEAAEPAGCWD